MFNGLLGGLHFGPMHLVSELGDQAHDLVVFVIWGGDCRCQKGCEELLVDGWHGFFSENSQKATDERFQRSKGCCVRSDASACFS